VHGGMPHSGIAMLLTVLLCLRASRSEGKHCGMPAAELVPYCASCDQGRALLAAAAEDEEARAAVLREHPRRLATKKDIAGTPMCARCLEYSAQHRLAGFYFEQQDCPRDSVF
jgi:hypothetical protein